VGLAEVSQYAINSQRLIACDYLTPDLPMYAGVCQDLCMKIPLKSRHLRVCLSAYLFTTIDYNRGRRERFTC
jgi:hypothetical protein